MSAHEAKLSANAAETAVGSDAEKSCIVLVFDDNARSLSIRPGPAHLELPCGQFDERMAKVLVEAAQELRSGHVHDPTWHQFVQRERERDDHFLTTQPRDDGGIGR